ARTPPARRRRARRPPPARATPSSSPTRLDRVEPRETMQEEATPVPRDGHEGSVGEAEHLPAGDRVHAVDPVLPVAEVGDAVDDRRRAGDRAACAERPDRPAARGGETVEAAVVRAEVDAPGPDRRRRVDVRDGGDGTE